MLACGRDCLPNQGASPVQVVRRKVAWYVRTPSISCRSKPSESGVKQETRGIRKRSSRAKTPRRPSGSAPRLAGSPVSGASTLADALEPDASELREFIADFYAAMSLMRLLRQEIAAALSLTAAEYSVLLAVWYLQPEGKMTVRAISEHLHVAAAYVTSEITRLVEKGLLTKEPHPSDGRAVGVALTKASRGIFIQLGPMLRAVNAPLFQGINRRDFDTVHRFLSNIIEHGYDAIRVARTYAVEKKPSARRRFIAGK
jgi:DNA-binding MarR family transcriptional regulator